MRSDDQDIALPATDEAARMLSRRRWLQLTAGGSVGLSLGTVVDVTEVRAATHSRPTAASMLSPARG